MKLLFASLLATFILVASSFGQQTTGKLTLVPVTTPSAPSSGAILSADSSNNFNITTGSGGVLKLNGTTVYAGGVASIAGTANQIAASGSTGAVTLSLAGPHAFTSLTSNAILTGNGSSAINAIGVSGTGNALTALNSITSKSGSNLSLTTADSGGGISIDSASATVSFTVYTTAGLLCNNTLGAIGTRTNHSSADSTLLGFLGSGTASSSNYLRGDGAWTNPFASSIVFTAGNSITAAASTDLTLNAGSGNQNVVLVPSGTGSVAVGAVTSLSASAPLSIHLGSNLNAAFRITGGHVQLVGGNDANSAYKPLYLDGLGISLNANSGGIVYTGGKLILGGNTDNSNGILQLASSTSSSAGIGFGTAATLYSQGAGGLTATASLTTSAPSGGTAGAWKHGIAVTTTGLLPSTTTYIQLDVGGVLYKVATYQ